MHKRATLGVAATMAYLAAVMCAATEGHLYATRDVLELDGCASAWLIKRFVDQHAEFRFYPKGALVSEGIAFNTPEAKWRRTQQMCTYEQILHDAGLQNAALAHIGAMVHEIELTYSRSYDTQANALNERILSIIRQAASPGQALEQSFAVFDELYRQNQ